MSPVAQELPACPTFQELMGLKAKLLQRPGVLDCTETRMAAVLSRDAPFQVRVLEKGYRCHVAKHWAALQGVPESWHPRVLVSQGVRHSLKTLFEFWAGQGRRLALPSDVYPVYLQLAAQAGIGTKGYSSLEGLESALPAVDVLLVANPFKPRGTELTQAELAEIKAWLQNDVRRRVVLDTVYRFEAGLAPGTKELYATGQCLVLHSLSKAWARPLVAGLALVPEQDVEELTPVFRGLELDRSTLPEAEALLTTGAHRPAQLIDFLRRRQAVLTYELTLRGLWGLLPEQALSGQYLFKVDRSWEDLLVEHGVLALPVSVFGSSCAEQCVLSSLPIFG